MAVASTGPSNVSVTWCGLPPIASPWHSCRSTTMPDPVASIVIDVRIAAPCERPGDEQPRVGLRVARSRGLADLRPGVGRTGVHGDQSPGFVDHVDGMVALVLVRDDHAERLR